MKRRENLPRSVHFLGGTETVERGRRDTAEFPFRNISATIFSIKDHCISESCDNCGRSTGISKVTARLKIIRLMEVK